MPEMWWDGNDLPKPFIKTIIKKLRNIIRRKKQ